MTIDKMRVNLRAVVLDVLMELEKPESLSHIILGQTLVRYQYLDKSERSFITRLTQGTLEKRIELEYIIDRFSKVPCRKQKPLIRNLLEMSVYQLKYMNGVPVSAVCNEAVKLTGKRGFATLKGFVNGVLRSIARNLQTVEYPSRDADITAYWSIRYSMPVWLIKHWSKRFTPEQIEAMLEGFEAQKRTFIRCNTAKVTPAQLNEHLKAEGIQVRPVQEWPQLDYAFEISGYDYLWDIKAFAAGEFQVQDISSMLAGEGGLIKQKDYIIDVCAAPGGKSINAALKAPDGHVEARDISEIKTAMIEENIARLELDNISCKIADAAVRDENAVEKADVLIADLPCSGLGIIGRKPDIKYNVSEAKLASLVLLQRKILSVVWEYVKPGGYMIYSTCTINKAENEDNTAWFCENFPFEPVEEPLQILPDRAHSDGFFIARLRRKIENG